MSDRALDLNLHLSSISELAPCKSCILAGGAETNPMGNSSDSIEGETGTDNSQVGATA